jgi:hypothetical protein
MAGGNRRKCKCCRTLFCPDPRNRHHQRYCSEAACRAASKAASQARWRAAPENQGYFRGPVNVARVQAWRSRHPGYWRRARRVGTALQDRPEQTKCPDLTDRRTKEEPAGATVEAEQEVMPFGPRPRATAGVSGIR